MPVNFQQALEQIRQMGTQALQIETEMRALREDAHGLLDKLACELDSLQQLVDRAGAENPYLRSAQPFDGCLNQTYAAPPPPAAYALLAADGSQINPDRHGQIEFGAINVGAIRLLPGQGIAPQEVVRSQLMFHSQLYTESGSPLTDDIVALMRDMAEREMLFELAGKELEAQRTGALDAMPLITLTDGPLELFREGKGMPEFEERFERYTQVLESIADLGASTAGYVDKPRGDLVVRLLELAALERKGQLSNAGRERPFRMLSDESIYRHLLAPGERSAVFGIHGGARQAFQGRLSLHFFYLNVGRVGHPYLSRVEIPRWVAASESLTNQLHAVLLAQAHQMGGKPYPYALHRAHEVAVIRFEERDQLEGMIAAELYRQGVAVGERSNKQVAKDTQYR